MDDFRVAVQITEECNYCGRIIHYSLGGMKHCYNKRCQKKHEQDYWQQYWFELGMREVEDFLKD